MHLPNREATYGEGNAFANSADHNSRKHSSFSRRIDVPFLFLFAGFFSLTWNIIRVENLNFTLSDFFFLALAAILLSTGRMNIRPFGSITPIWCCGLLLMLGGLFVSTIINADPIRWLSVASQYLFALLVMPMVIASFDRTTLDRCLAILVVGIAVSQAGAFIASLFFDYYDTWEYLGPDFITARGRIGALSGNSNANGAMVGYGLVVLVYVSHRRLLPGWALISSGAALVWGLIGSASFTAFALATLAVPVAFFIVSPRKALIGTVTAFVALAIFASADLPLPSAFEERVAGALASGELQQAGTFEGRWDIAKEAWELSGQTLVVGFGADGYRLVSASGAPVHVLPLLILTEGGLISLVGLLLLIAILWGYGISWIGSHRASAALVIGLLIIFTGFTLAAPHMYSRFWLGPVLLGILQSRSLFWQFGGPYTMFGYRDQLGHFEPKTNEKISRLGEGMS